MKQILSTAALLAALSAPQLLQAEELLGAALITRLSNTSFACVQGETPLEWAFATLDPSAQVVPYQATVNGKTIEAEYQITAEGRLTSDGYGAERQVTLEDDGRLIVTRADGKVMVCIAN